MMKQHRGLKGSVIASTSAGLEAIGQASTEIGQEFSASLTSEIESNEFPTGVETEITFSAPPGKHIKVLRLEGEYRDHLGDSFGFQGSTFKIDEID